MTAIKNDNDETFYPSVVLGIGQVGEALLDVFTKSGETDRFTPGVALPLDQGIPQSEVKSYNISCEVMHVCFPWSSRFFDELDKWMNAIDAKFIAIHSTVPVGTTSRVSPSAVHSPVVGVHPRLQESLRKFPKFVGGPNNAAAAVMRQFKNAGMQVLWTPKAETTEFLKLMSTFRFGVEIEFAKMIARLALENDLPVDAIHRWTANYNAGYEKMGLQNFRRSDLVPFLDEIGGHCVLPNIDLLERSGLSSRNLAKFLALMRGVTNEQF